MSVGCALEVLHSCNTVMEKVACAVQRADPPNKTGGVIALVGHAFGWCEWEDYN